MVKKLFKHETMAYLRVMLLVYGILLGVSALARFVQLFENESTIYNIVFGSSMLAYGVAVIAALGAAVVFGVVRFHKNLFTAEGYLTFTLPVTATQHLVVKVVTAVIFELLTLLTVVVSACIVTAGDVLVEIVKLLVYVLEKLISIAGWHTLFYALEFLVLLIVASFSGFLLYYTCIALGQLFKKNRVLAAVGIYFAYYMFNQVVSTIIIVVGSLAAEFLDLSSLGEFVAMHPYASVHIAFASMLLFASALTLVYFCVTRWVVRRRLNLE